MPPHVAQVFEQSSTCCNRGVTGFALRQCVDLDGLFDPGEGFLER